MKTQQLTARENDRAWPEGVTIAIPNWNHELLLPRSISSALQAVKRLAAHGVPAETLVIDDCSRDGSLALLRQLEALLYEEGLRVMSLKYNGRLGAARNQALRHATYRYIAFLDADNELIPENVYHFYRAIRDTEAALVFGNLLCQGGEAKNQLLHSNESFQARIFRENYIDACCLSDRAQLLDVGGYQTGQSLNGIDDWELNLHLATQGRKLIFVPMLFAIYYTLPNSMINDVPLPSIYHAHRIYNQLGARDQVPHNTTRLRYHPDIGYL